MTVARDIRPVPFDAGMLLLANGERLLAYNASAHHVWRALADGESPSQIASMLSRTFGIDPAKTAADVEAIISHWRGEGLLDGSSSIAVRLEPPDDRRSAQHINWSASWSCRFGGRSVEFAVEDPISAALLRGPLRPLEADVGTPETRIEVRVAGDGTSVVLRDGSPRRTSGAAEGLKEAVYQALIEFLWPGRTVDTLLHAAAVACGDIAICFPAASGSGKSTLIACLSGHGFEYLADDLTAVDPGAEVLPLPLPISLKEGSWPVMDESFPGTDSSDVFRVGQTLVRLVTPPDAWSARPTRLGALIFPQYASGSDAVVARIRPSEALVRLRDAGIWLGHPLIYERVVRFARWLESTPTYALQYSRPSEALAHIEHIVADLQPRADV